MSLFYELIQKYDVITVFRHQNPDPDALGSQWGLVSWLKETFPNKAIYALGKHVGVKPQLFEAYDLVEDSVVSSSLAIILDTANAARIDDQRFSSAKMRLKIDHHPLGEAYAQHQIVDETASSTSEIIAGLIKEFMLDEAISSKAAKYLYMGILTDSLNFSTSNVTHSTLENAAYLAKSHLDLPKINEELYLIDENEFKFVNRLRNLAIVEKGLIYAIVTKALTEECNITPNMAKEHVNDLGLVREYEIWVLFVQQEIPNQHLYNGSIRSRNVTINDIAIKYNGGGHRLAAAVKNLSLSEIQSVIHDLKGRLYDQKIS
ncbi:MAG: bifunctional oligoribonuclease/PAP phosphatase NrnA [Erysipelotrichaceae bacterium]|nr:bifunctional oligoribonuclease/PAP phosphatase NrnA [Erysipelotrichaceae bacterium]